MANLSAIAAVIKNFTIKFQQSAKFCNKNVKSNPALCLTVYLTHLLRNSAFIATHLSREKPDANSAAPLPLRFFSSALYPRRICRAKSPTQIQPHRSYAFLVRHFTSGAFAATRGILCIHYISYTSIQAMRTKYIMYALTNKYVRVINEAEDT